MRTLLLSACAVVSLIGAGIASAQETGVIAGKLVDSRGKQILTGHAAVFVCSAESGRPFKRETFQVLGTEGVQIQGLADLAHAVTDAKGNFELAGVPAGKYRLVAQSWQGQAGVPDREDPSEVVSLHGVCEDVEVNADEKASVTILPLGTATMTLINDPEEEHAFLVLSTGAMRGDPVLPFPFWGERFARHAIGITLMETHQVTFHGLPDREIHAGLFNYDNNPGVGGASFSVVDGETARIPIYATWSNGKYAPPAGLLPLVQHLEKTGTDVEELLKKRYAAEVTTEENRNPVFPIVLKHGDDVLELEGFGKVRVLDLAAADRYRGLRAHHAKR